MLWLLLALAVAGFLIYRLDKKLKAKYDDSFNPVAWNLPAIEDVVPAGHQVVATTVEYLKQDAVLSLIQQPLFCAMHALFANDYWVMANVPVAFVIKARSHQAHLSAKIMPHVFDIVLCDKNNFSPMCVVLLDATAQTMENILSACEVANVAVVRVRIQHHYDLQELQAQVLKALPSVTTSVVTTNIPSEAASNAADALAIEYPPEVEHKDCPYCSSTMVKRTAKRGQLQGKLCWVCSTYPHCKGILLVR